MAYKECFPHFFNRIYFFEGIGTETYPGLTYKFENESVVVDLHCNVLIKTNFRDCNNDGYCILLVIALVYNKEYR